MERRSPSCKVPLQLNFARSPATEFASRRSGLISASPSLLSCACNNSLLEMLGSSIRLARLIQLRQLVRGLHLSGSCMHAVYAGTVRCLRSMRLSRS